VRVPPHKERYRCIWLLSNREEKVKYDEFINEVQDRGHMDSRDEVEKVTRGTLEVLAERLGGGEPHNVASQLPPELAPFLRYEGEETNNPVSLDDLFKRVNERDERWIFGAVYQARVVIGVLQDVVTGGGIDHVRSQLPAEYSPLFEAGSQGKMST
jgi:uncharacterized protein (DUF2267 family)